MPKKRDVYHVTPGPDGGWNVKKEGNTRASGKFNTKTDAVSRGKELAQKSPLGQIKIHKKDGTIQTEHTYGSDPEKYKG